MRLLAPFIAGLVLGVSLFSCNGPAFAFYDGPKSPDPAVGAWVTSLFSDHGRCCDLGDATVDVPWQSSATATSGYAILFDGQWVNVDTGSMHIFTHNSSGGEDVVTDNKVNEAIVWFQSYPDPVTRANGVYIDPTTGMPLVRCFLPGGAY